MASVTNTIRPPVREAFQVSTSLSNALAHRKARLEQRRRKQQWQERQRRLFADRNIHYELSQKVQGGRFGGLGVGCLLVRRLGLADAIDEQVHLLKRHLPYHESDHILNLAYNLLCGGTALADIDRHRCDDTFLNALGVECIPDPTTAGDFLRRFKEGHIAALMRVINDKRLLVWKRQGHDFFEHAIVEVDGSIVGTSAACKQGTDLSHKGIWGYHPLLVSLANTREPLFLVNRAASRPSHDGAAPWLGEAAELCRRAGFRKVTFRGDTDFSQTTSLDGWDEQDIRFVFGIDAMPNLVGRAEGLPPEYWQRLERPARYEVKTEQRTRPKQFKEEVVKEKGYKDLRLQQEDVSEFSYRPGACRRAYRVVALRKHIAVRKYGEQVEEQRRYFFYITNELEWSAAEVVYFANDRCNQENLIAQLKSGVPALRLPVNTLNGNWAYMVIGALAWSLKIWLGLLQPKQAEREELLKMEFKRFLQTWISLAVQVVRQGHRIIYRLLQYNDAVETLLNTVGLLRRIRFG